MLRNESVSGIELLEFGQQSRGNVSRTLQRPQQEFDAVLPFLEIGSSRSGFQDVCGAETFVVFDEFDDVHRFHHEHVLIIAIVRWKSHNGGDFFSNHSGGGVNIVVGHKNEVVFDVFEPESESHPNTKRAVIIVVQGWNEGWIIGDQAGWLHKRIRGRRRFTGFLGSLRGDDLARKAEGGARCPCWCCDQGCNIGNQHQE
mmetsp:Transcript_6642/g.14146  ORF Transcript_6642/g.14146 Transcript_6642/m.14146 type:complete len:200 (+) Transcript_6642:820-1419(+)